MPLNRRASVGLMAVAGLACAGVLVVFLGNIHFASPGYRVTVLFNYVDSLKTEAPVLYGGGVQIGVVGGMAIRDGKVAVELDLDKAARIPADSQVTIHTAGILGEKYIQVEAGDGAVGYLSPDAAVVGLDPGSLDRTLQKLELLSDYLEPLLKDPRVLGGVDKLLTNMDKAAVNLNGMIAEDRGDMKASLGNLRDLTGNLDKTSREARPLVANAGKLLSDANVQKAQRSLDHLDDSMDKVDQILTHVQQKKGTLGVLVFDDQTGENLRELLSDLKRHPWKLLWKK